MIEDKKRSGVPNKIQIYIRIAVVSYLLLMDSTIVTYIFPYLGRIIMDFDLISNPLEEGKYTGYVTAAYYIGRAVAGPAWGFAADSWGRKPVIYLSASLVAIFNFFFGIAGSFGSLLLFRFLSGCSNTVSGISMTLSTEVCTPETKSLGLAVALTIWCVGENIGPLIGGTFLDFFPSEPYLMTTFVTSGMCIGGIFLTMFLIEETLVPSNQSNQQAQQNNITQDQKASLKSPLLQTYKESITNANSKRRETINITNKDQEKSYSNKNSVAVEMQQLNDPQDRRGNDNELQTSLQAPQEPPQLQQDNLNNRPKERSIVIDLVVLSAICNCFFIILRLVFPQWVKVPYDQGGLGLTEKDISMILGVNAIPGLILTPLLYPYLSRILGDAKMIYFYSIINMACFPMIPLTRVLFGSSSMGLTKVYLVFIWFVRQTVAFFGTLSFQRLINDSVDTANRGKLNNISRTFSSFLSVIIPGVMSYIMSCALSSNWIFPFNYFLVFLMCSAIGIVTHKYMVSRIQTHGKVAL